MKRLYILTLCSLCLAVSIFFYKKRKPTTSAPGQGLIIPKEWLLSNKNPVTPEKDRRPADQTLLTYPEWFLVFSPEEQARYFRHHTVTTFPFRSHTAQIWESYKIVNNQVKGNFPTNTGYHFMIWVIGTSASVEYLTKAWYETVVGRITDTGAPVTDEDRFNAKFTQEYVDFIKERPWYEFDFKSRLKSLWATTSLWNDNILRKWERKYILTSELLVKYGYGKLIGLGTREVYEEALPTTAIILENDSLRYLPRYDRFASAVTKLAKEGHRFKEIAGNNSAVLLTVIVPAENSTRFENTRTIFTQPISSNPKIKRIALVVPVPALNELLVQMERAGMNIEHVFDY
jgi:hypothetical protein